MKFRILFIQHNIKEPLTYTHKIFRATVRMYRQHIFDTTKKEGKYYENI